jgi:DNA/RNA-binding domain of Phe-tRNA-synthetase-like protein
MNDRSQEPLELIPLALDPTVAGRVRAAAILARPVVVGPAAQALDAEIAATCAALAARHAGKAPGEIPGLTPARDLYKAFGIDPTRTRPSSESLLRRVLQGKPFPRILNAVDVCNLCAVEFLLPIGLYDAGKLRGAVTLRRGGPGESYAGIRKDDVHLEGRPTLSDQEGPFGNPTSDSLRACVTEQTRSLWMVIFAPGSYPRPALESHARRAAELIGRHLSGPGEPAISAAAFRPE